MEPKYGREHFVVALGIDPAGANPNPGFISAA
jgi:hypothetical protein